MKNNTENHEYSIYGSSRVGNYSTTHGFVAQNGAMILERVLGKRQYELSNHLGNVLTTLTDQKYRVSNVNTDYLYQPIVTSATDYFPFGMQMPGRTYTLQNGKYRYGFNGMEKDDEVKGSGNSYTALNWMYDPRTGRRNEPDKKMKIWESSYATLGNNPIKNIDPKGDNWYSDAEGYTFWKKGSELQIIKDGDVYTDIGPIREFYSAYDDGTAFRAVYYQDQLVNFYDESIEQSGNAESSFIPTIKGFRGPKWAEDIIKDWGKTVEHWHEMAETSTDAPGTYSPPNFDAIGVHVQGSAGGFVENSSVQAGFYGEGNTVGGFASLQGGAGGRTPDLSWSVGLDFFKYGDRGIDAKAYFAGTSVSTSLQLGIFAFTKTSSSNYETPFKSNKTLNVYSIDVGPKGFGFTRNVGNTLLFGVHTFNTNSSNSTSNECDDECTE